MANSYLESIKEARELAKLHLQDWKDIDEKVLSVVTKMQQAGGKSIDNGSIKELNAKLQAEVSLRKELSAAISEQEVKIKKLQTELSKLSQARNQNAKSAKNQQSEEAKLNQARKEAEKAAKKQEQAEAKLAATREKSVSKQLTGQMQEYVASIGRTNDGLKKMNAYYRELEKTSQKAFANSTDGQVLKKQIQAQERLNQVKHEGWKEVEASRQAANEEAKAARALGSAYAEASNELRIITKEYQDLAIRKARNNDLTTEEIKSMDALEAQIMQLRPQLVAVDQKVGNFSRSVGSYGKQFDSLSFSMAQITREMPAFAYGAQIGFAALSNNIPMLVDEIHKVKQATAELKAEGKATTPVLKQIGMALFSWQTLLSVAVTLLTIYGDELIEAAGGLFDFRSEAEKAADSLEAMNKTVEDHIKGLTDLAKAQLEGTQSAQDELLALELLDKQLQDVSVSEEDRIRTLETLKNKYPKHLKNMTNEELLAKGLGDAYEELANDILTAAKSRAAYDKISKNAGRLLEVEAALAVKQAANLEAQEKLNAAQKVYNDLKDKGASFREDALPLAKARMDDAAEAAAKLSEEVRALTGEQQKLEISNINMLENIEDANFLLEESADSLTKSTREQIEALEEMNMVRKYSVAYYEQIISALQEEQSKVSQSSEQWATYQKAIDAAADSIKRIQDLQKYAREELAMSDEELDAFNIEVITTLSTKGIEEGMKRLSQITGRDLEDLYKQFAHFYDNTHEGFQEFWDNLVDTEEIGADRIKELRREVAESAVDFGSALFEAEIERINERIEANKDYYAQLLAGEELTEERRAALEAERDLRERKLLKERRKREREQLLFEKAAALVEIAINTAVAVSAAMKSPLIAPGLIPWIIASGAVQAATVVAQAIPAFAKGTENAPAGWAIVDEVQPEVHTDKRGRVKSFGSEKGANLRFLEHGDRIHRSRKAYFDKIGPEAIQNTIFDLNMQHQGKPVPEQNVDGALLREMSAMRGDSAKLWREVKKLASRPIYNNVKVVMPDNKPY